MTSQGKDQGQAPDHRQRSVGDEELLLRENRRELGRHKVLHQSINRLRRGGCRLAVVACGRRRGRGVAAATTVARSCRRTELPSGIHHEADRF